MQSKKKDRRPGVTIMWLLSAIMTFVIISGQLHSACMWMEGATGIDGKTLFVISGIVMLLFVIVTFVVTVRVYLPYISPKIADKLEDRKNERLR